MATDNMYRGEHVGRLAAPDQLPPGDEPSDSRICDWVKRAFALQKVMGLTCGTDGEYGRPADLHARLARQISTSPSLLAPAAEYAKSVAPMPLKVSLPSPSAVVRTMRTAGSAVDPAAALAAIVAEAHALFEAGVDYVLLNASGYDALLVDNLAADQAAELAGLVALDLEAAEAISRPASVRLGLRIGRRGQTISWDPRGPAATSLERVLNAPVDHFYLDFDDAERTFAVLDRIAPTAGAALGLVDTRPEAKQDREDIWTAIDAAARRAGGERLALGTRGGFLAETGTNWTHQRKTLEFLSDVVSIWWGVAA